jgi:methionyl-tRNA formyltransferase
VERARTIFFGSGTFALPALESLTDPSSSAAALVDLRAVVTAPPRPAGRRGDLQPTPVATAAEAGGLPVLTPASLRAEASLDELRALDPELVVLADYGRLIPSAILDLPRHGALNLHPSMLPRHRGAAPVPAAILAGDSATGVTLMRMDEGMDSGPIVAQREVTLDGTETTPQLEARLAGLAAALLVELLPAWLEGTLAARPQPVVGITLTRPLRRADGRLDAARPAVELERQVRAYQPWPGSYLEIPGRGGRGGDRLVVWRSSVEEAAEAHPVGTLVPSGDGLALQTGQAWLRLDEVQPAGGRRMSGAEYRRGRRG